jgi:translation initiation factor 4A
MPPGVLEIARKLMKNPVRIHVKRGERTLDGIQQFYLDVEKEDWKFDTLLDLYETIGMSKSIIFVNTRRKMEWLASNMRKKDFATVSTIHGDMDQNDRDNIMRELRDHTIGILITSDQLPCGVDVRRNFVAINYDLPTKPENYLHRIGRSDESCWKHIAINFVTRDDKRMMNDIQRFYNVTIEVLPEPDDIADLL